MSHLNAFLVSTIIGTSLLGMPVRAWEQETQLMTQQEECIPAISVSDNVVDNTIRIRVGEENTCPISDKVFLFIQDDRPQPLRLPGIRANFLSDTWVVKPGEARPGRYRVMGINPVPSGIGDDGYISSRHLGIDQVITIGVSRQEQSALTPPQVVLPPAPRQESRPEPPQVQGTGQKTLLDIAWCVYSKLGHIIWAGWKTDLSPLEVCFPR